MAMMVSVAAFGQEVRNPDFRKGFRLRLRSGIFRKEYMLMFQVGTMCFRDFMSELVWG